MLLYKCLSCFRGRGIIYRPSRERHVVIVVGRDRINRYLEGLLKIARSMRFHQNSFLHRCFNWTPRNKIENSRLVRNPMIKQRIINHVSLIKTIINRQRPRGTWIFCRIPRKIGLDWSIKTASRFSLNGEHSHVFILR